jgi:hypothetical protein
MIVVTSNVGELPNVIIETDIVKDPTLSKGALKLYIYLMSLNMCSSGKNADIGKDLGMSVSAICKYKRELRNRDLIYTRPKESTTYVGNLANPASLVCKIHNMEVFCDPYTDQYVPMGELKKRMSELKKRNYI